MGIPHHVDSANESYRLQKTICNLTSDIRVLSLFLLLLHFIPSVYWCQRVIWVTKKCNSYYLNFYILFLFILYWFKQTWKDRIWLWNSWINLWRTIKLYWEISLFCIVLLTMFYCELTLMFLIKFFSLWKWYANMGVQSSICNTVIHAAMALRCACKNPVFYDGSS